MRAVQVGDSRCPCPACALPCPDPSRPCLPTPVCCPALAPALPCPAVQRNDWPEKDAGVQTAFMFTKCEGADDMLIAQASSSLNSWNHLHADSSPVEAAFHDALAWPALPAALRPLPFPLPAACHLLPFCSRRSACGRGRPVRSGCRCPTLATSCTRRPSPCCSTATAGRWVRQLVGLCVSCQLRAQQR